MTEEQCSCPACGAGAALEVVELVETYFPLTKEEGSFTFFHDKIDVVIVNTSVQCNTCAAVWDLEDFRYEYSSWEEDEC